MTFKFISKEDMMETRNFLVKRFENARTVPGTRSYHYFQPVSTDSIGTKSTSSDATFDIVFDFTKKKNDIAKVKAFDYIVCTYDRKCWIGMVNQIDAQCEDLLVNYCYILNNRDTTSKPFVIYIWNIKVIRYNTDVFSEYNNGDEWKF